MIGRRTVLLLPRTTRSPEEDVVAAFCLLDLLLLACLLLFLLLCLRHYPDPLVTLLTVNIGVVYEVKHAARCRHDDGYRNVGLPKLKRYQSNIRMAWGESSDEDGEHEPVEEVVVQAPATIDYYTTRPSRDVDSVLRQKLGINLIHVRNMLF